MNAKLDYVAVGGNARSSAADWHPVQEVLAFGAGQGIAMWKPSNDTNKGIYAILKAHEDTVGAVSFLDLNSDLPFLVTGSDDAHLQIWKPEKGPNDPITFCAINPARARATKVHLASITCLAVSCNKSGIFASGSADETIAVWQLHNDERGIDCSHMQTINPEPRLIPLSLAIFPVGPDSHLLAIGGTARDVLLYSSNGIGDFGFQTLLKGHDGWVQALKFAQAEPAWVKWVEGMIPDNRDILLASASQDKYIRVWRISQSGTKTGDHSRYTEHKQTLHNHSILSSRLYQVSVGTHNFTASLDALLAGHDDWIYSVDWFFQQDSPRILSASADSSLIVWSVDVNNGLWYASQRLGELSAMKGSTTATGSMGGFYNALWNSVGSEILGLSRTGSWTRWVSSNSSDEWHQDIGISGHSRAIRDISWSQDGGFLLSTSEDRTTRLHAKWAKFASWHEFSRPQIHGYDLNCIETVGANQFVSGAEEKLLRTFDEPDDVAILLHGLCGVSVSMHRDISSAGIPVLGLSNKASEMQAHVESSNLHSDSHLELPPSRVQFFRPPSEDYLAKFSLWPEREKLYGHGFEVNALAVSHDSKLIATSCKASSVEHAAIRIFSTSDWQQQLPALKAHALTVTSMSFSFDDSTLVSVGRDRKWVVWEKKFGGRDNGFIQIQSESKAHSRMIKDVTWISSAHEKPTFVTGGRDKVIKIWCKSHNDYELLVHAEVESPVLALAALQRRHHIVIAAGLENGRITLHQYSKGLERLVSIGNIHERLTPAGPITGIAWQPSSLDRVNGNQSSEAWLAIVSEDNTLRILALSFGHYLEQL